MKVFLVSTGSYSDEHTVGIFSTQEKAEAEKALWPETNDIQEWELDVKTDHPAGCLFFRVTMDADGNGGEVEQKGPEQHGNASYHGDWYDKDGSCSFYVWAKDETHAIQIANDRRTQHKAMGGSP